MPKTLKSPSQLGEDRALLPGKSRGRSCSSRQDVGSLVPGDMPRCPSPRLAAAHPEPGPVCQDSRPSPQGT